MSNLSFLSTFLSAFIAFEYFFEKNYFFEYFFENFFETFGMIKPLWVAEVAFRRAQKWQNNFRPVHIGNFSTNALSCKLERLVCPSGSVNWKP